MILEFINVEKSFGAKKVLKGVNFTAKSRVENGYLVRNRKKNNKFSYTIRYFQT